MTKSSLSRRAIAVVAVSAIALSACGGSSPVASTKDAFVVNSTAYSLDSFETLLADLVENQQLEAAANGQASKEDAVSVMRTLLRYEAYKLYLDENGLSENPSDRSKVEQEATASEGFSTLPDYLQQLLINLNVAQATMETFKPYSAATLKTLYNRSPASTGVLCMSHILLETEDEANDVLKELAGGAKFADVAKKRSIEPAAKESGGSLSANDEPCTDMAYFQQQFDPAFMKGVVAAKAGVPTGPVKTQFGFHIVLNHAYDDIKESLAKIASEKPSVSNLIGYLATADISVNPTYGVWNGAMATID
ncbi:MAG: peptidylprolyl isomerase [Ilumatobacteraceae bacterium]